MRLSVNGTRDKGVLVVETAVESCGTMPVITGLWEHIQNSGLKKIIAICNAIIIAISTGLAISLIIALVLFAALAQSVLNGWNRITRQKSTR